jgi:RimJ/RimL family protein N-acetyltransferase
VTGDESLWEFSSMRLRMRPMTTMDEALYCELFTDARTMRYIGAPLSPERARRSFRGYIRSELSPVNRVFIAIVEKITARPLGILTIQQLDERRRRVEAGIMLKRLAHARGYAREALAALVARAFAVLPIDEVWVGFAADHRVVERLVVSVGFERSYNAAAREDARGSNIWSATRDSWCL